MKKPLISVIIDRDQMYENDIVDLLCAYFFDVTYELSNADFVISDRVETITATSGCGVYVAWHESLKECASISDVYFMPYGKFHVYYPVRNVNSDTRAEYIVSQEFVGLKRSPILRLPLTEFLQEYLVTPNMKI